MKHSLNSDLRIKQKKIYVKHFVYSMYEKMLASLLMFALLWTYCSALVAQLDRALPSGGKGHGFESLRVHHCKNLYSKNLSL